MADKKISALTGASTPLDGTEVLPIVQSGSTVKVTNNDLRPKQIQANGTSGVMQVTGPAAASTRVMTIPDANFTAARTDAAQTFTGDQSFSNNIKSTGNTDGYSGPAAITTIASGASGTVSQCGGGVTLVSGGISFNNFWDLVIWQFAGNAVTISSAAYGSPSTRSYSVSSGDLVLAIANNNNTGTYSIGVTNIGN